MATSVLIVEDEPEFMRRFSDAVTGDPELRLLAAVSTGRAGLAMLDAQPPDVMLVDLGLPDLSGVALIQHAARHHPACDVLVVTMFGDDQHVLSSIEAGATGYLLKDAVGVRIAAAIHELRAGGSPISPSIARCRRCRRARPRSCAWWPRASASTRWARCSAFRRTPWSRT
jgi:DNA-binding NarL/FixJ family response regulator